MWILSPLQLNKRSILLVTAIIPLISIIVIVALVYLTMGILLEPGGFVGIAYANPPTQYTWIGGVPVQTNDTLFLWVGGEPYVIMEAGVGVCSSDIANVPGTWNIGTVSENTSYWSSGSAPAWPLDDAECAFTITNNSGGAVSITINSTDFIGGVGWTLAGSPGVDVVTMKAGESGDANEAAMVTLNATNQGFISGLGNGATKKWELKLESALTHSDGTPKQAVVTLTATCD